LTGNILLPALRAHSVRPKSLPAIWSGLSWSRRLLTDATHRGAWQDLPSPLRGSVALAADRDAPASLRLRVNLLSSQVQTLLIAK